MMRRKLVIYVLSLHVLIFLVLSFNLAFTTAQDDLPTPAIDATTEVSPTSEQPVENPTSEPAMPTQEAGTLTPSELPPPPDTPAPISTPVEPPLALIYGTTFDDGNLTNWQFGAGWSLVPSDSGLALQVANSAEPAAMLYNPLADVVVQARLRVTSGAAARIDLRLSASGSYSVWLSADGLLELRRADQLLASQQINTVSPDGWRTLRISIIGGIIAAEVDGVQVIAVEDDSPLPSGALTFAGVFPEQSPEIDPNQNTLTVDDVYLWIPADEFVPPPTEIIIATLPPPPAYTPTEIILGTLPPPPTYTPSETVSDTPTATDTPTETRTVEATEAVGAQGDAQFQLFPAMLTPIPSGDTPGLIAAINAANTNPCAPEPTVINLTQGAVYNLTTVAENSFGPSGLPAVRCAIIINGNDAIIQRSYDPETPDFRIFSIDSGDLTLDHVTISNGFLLSGGGGAGISNVFGTLTVLNSIISGNTISYSDNLAIRGAAISSFNGNVTIQNTTLSDNHNLGTGSSNAVNGGAVAIDGSRDGSRHQIVDSQIFDNSTTHSGGGVYIIFSSADIIRTVIHDNSAGLTGGAAYLDNGGFTITESNLANNTADFDGGAIYASGTTIQNTCITGNSHTGVAGINGAFIDATNNWWGDPSGPSGAVGGLGDSDCGKRYFRPAHRNRAVRL